MKAKKLILLALLLLVALTSCSKTSGDGDGERIAVVKEKLANACKTQNFDFPDGFIPRSSGEMAVDGEYIYVNGITNYDAKTSESDVAVCRFNLDGSNAVVSPRNDEFGARELSVRDGEIFTVESVITANEETGERFLEDVIIKKIKDGAEEFTFSASELFGVSVAGKSGVLSAFSTSQILSFSTDTTT